MTSTVVYNGELRTTCTHIKSNSSFENDAPVDNHGKGERFSPTDMMATSLASCMLTMMGIKARTMDLDVDLHDLKVEVVKVMKPEPRRIGGIELKFEIPDAMKKADEKTIAILKHTANTCPVMNSIHPDIEVKVDWGAWS
jgi:uncharacterized OsmC-like protein